MADQVESRSAAGSERGSGWGLVLALILLLMVLWVVSVRRQPPAPKSAQAPAAEFSAGRAMEVLRDLVGDGRPHPAGSPANAAIRDKIVARLRQLGYTPEIQTGFACGQGSGTCGRVENVVARLEGTARDGAVLMMAHYDSVGGGPGVSDDLAGVASILESARALKAGPAPRNPVIFLLDDGEEMGLLGAEAFAQTPLAQEVKAIVNLEARGTSGPSMMFETSGDDAWMVPLYAERTSRPITSSVFVAIYQLMPNDTDLTVFKRKDVDGLNFAYIGNPTHYHTTLDSLESLSPASLQHHGDNALGAARGLAQADLANTPKGDAVFFDVLGWAVVRWPAAWTLPLAVLVLVLVLAVFWGGKVGGRVTVGQMMLGLLAFLAVVVVTGLLAFGLSLLIRGMLPVPWIARPWPLVAAFWLMSLVVAGLLLPAMGRRAGLLGVFTGVWLGWSLLGLALAVAAPGISYLFLVPALIAGVAGLVLVRGSSPATAAVTVMLPVLIAGILWFPVLLPLYDGLGLGALVPIAVLRAILIAALAPLFVAARPLALRLVIGLALIGVVGGIGLAVASPPYSETSPQPMVFQYHQGAGEAQGQWLVRGAAPFPQAVRQAAQFGTQPEKPFPWSFAQARAWKAPAPALGAPAPELAVVEQGATPDGKRRLRLRLASPRGAHMANLVIPNAAKLQSLAIDGHPVDVENKGPEYFILRLQTLSPQGAVLDVVLGENAPQEWYVVDQSTGLPPTGEALRRARPATVAPFQDGDVTLMSRKVRI